MKKKTKKDKIVNTTTISISMSKVLSKELRRKANNTGVTLSTYCKVVLTKWVESELKMNLEG
jgi:predicted DNA-binding protein